RFRLINAVTFDGIFVLLLKCFVLLASLLKKITQLMLTLTRQHASNMADAMFEVGARQQYRLTFNSPRLRLRCSINQSLNPRMHQSAHAHSARFYGDI